MRYEVGSNVPRLFWLTRPKGRLIEVMFRCVFAPSDLASIAVDEMGTCEHWRVYSWDIEGQQVDMPSSSTINSAD